MSTSHNAFLPPDLRELIDADRSTGDPPEAVRLDVARRVDRVLGLGGAMLLPVPSTVGKWDVTLQVSLSVAPAGAAAGVAAWKIAVGIAVVALAGGGGFTLAKRQAAAPALHDQATAAALTSTAPISTAPTSPSNTAMPSVSLDLDAPIEAAAASRAQSSERAHPARAIDRLAEERKLLDRARSALVRRDAAEALSALRAHEKSYSRGQLVEEREGMRVQALVLAHDFGSARAAGERFRKVYSHSVFLPVVDRALESAR
jgi:hypothetical protein